MHTEHTHTCKLAEGFQRDRLTGCCVCSLITQKKPEELLFDGLPEKATFLGITVCFVYEKRFTSIATALQGEESALTTNLSWEQMEKDELFFTSSNITQWKGCWHRGKRLWLTEDVSSHLGMQKKKKRIQEVSAYWVSYTRGSILTTGQGQWYLMTPYRYEQKPGNNWFEEIKRSYRTLQSHHLDWNKWWSTLPM